MRKLPYHIGLIGFLLFLLAWPLLLRGQGYDPISADYLRAWQIGAGGGGELWTPADLGNDLALWLDAADTSTVQLSGSSVTNWLDKSLNAYSVDDGNVTSRRPTYTQTQNNLNVLTFNGSRLVSSAFTLSQPHTRFAVLSSATANLRAFTDSYNNVQSAHYFGSSKAIALACGSTFATATETGEIGWSIQSAIANGASSVIYQNGTNMRTGNAGSNGMSGISIGNLRGNPNPVAGYSLDGDLAEIVMVASALSTADRQRVEGYLAHKWGLTANLPSDHPYKSAAPTK